MKTKRKKPKSAWLSPWPWLITMILGGCFALFLYCAHEALCPRFDRAQALKMGKAACEQEVSEIHAEMERLIMTNLDLMKERPMKCIQHKSKRRAKHGLQ